MPVRRAQTKPIDLAIDNRARQKPGKRCASSKGVRAHVGFAGSKSSRPIFPRECLKTIGMAKGKFAIGDYQLAVRRSRTGRGLFTVGPIEKGRCVVEYTGRVLSEAETYTSRSKYLFAVSTRKTIDGRAKSNIARYINHSCRPNCEVEISRGRVYILARRAIKPGEELFYDYGTEYLDQHIRPKGCKCAKCMPDGF
jgi:hypothetical protein